MIRCALTTILLSSLLISCGSDDKQEESVVNDLLGTWKSPCSIDDSDPDDIEYTSITLEIEEKTINLHHNVYTTSACENLLLSIPSEITYSLGEQATTSSGDDVRNIDITISDGTVVLDIFKLEQSYLYFGEERDDGLRSDFVDFTIWFEKQD